MMESSLTLPSVTDEGFEASPQQARVWTRLQERSQTERGCALGLRLPPDTDEVRLRQALVQLVERHEILRTRLQRVGALNQPLQFINGQPLLSWAGEAAQGEGLRVAIDRRTDGLHLRLQLEAGLLDGDSMVELAMQWAEAYAGHEAEEAPLQYADYAAWRSELIADDNAGRLFWSQRLQTADVPRLPLRAAPAVLPPPAGTGRLELPVDEDMRQAVAGLAAQLGCEVGHILLGAWLALLQRHIGSDSLALEIEWPQRHEDLDGALGLFAEPLPLLLPQLETSDFAGLCRRLVEELDRLNDYRDSFPSTAAAPRSVGFRYLDGGDRVQIGTRWALQEVSVPRLALLQLTVERLQGRLALYLEFAESVYTSAAIARLAAQLRSALLAAARNDRQSLAELQLLDEAELTAMRAWSTADALSAAQEQQYQSIAGLDNLTQCFEAAVQRHASVTAVADTDGELTYAELNRQSTWLARQLLGSGLQAGDIVAHCLPRDRRAVVALLAIVKAGGIYLPVDPHYPAARIGHLLQDSQARWLISTRAALAELPAGATQPGILLLDEVGASDDHADLPGVKCQPSATAYLIYTSGSTGLPKGVPITHHAALHSLAARVAYYPERVERYLLLSSFAFDSSIAGLFWSLAQGACLQIAGTEQQKDARALAELIVRGNVSHLLALPSLHALLLEQLAAAPQLKAVIVAGERCDAALVRRHRQRLPHVVLYNEYGPTEAAVWSTVQRCELSDAQLDGAGVPIGRPIPGAAVWVLDEQLRPLPAGLSGELCIAGPGLSAGYLHRPELTQEKFVTVPALDGLRVYRTGDYAYVDEEGRLHFLGRQDGQLKIRGHRVELGEIEQALNRIVSPAQAVVLAEETAQGPILRAFVASEAGTDASSALDALARILPEYMLPVELQVLPQFPQTANGKIDGKALLARERQAARPAYRAPAAGVEQLLAALWEELLAARNIGLDDDFFALGGHSLLVVQLVYRIQQVFGITVPVATVFQHSRLAALAAALALDDERRLVSLRAGEGACHLLCCDPGDALQYYLPLVQGLPAGVSAWGLVLPVAETPATTGLSELARCYAQEILDRDLQGAVWLCGWSMGGLLALETARCLEHLGAAVAGVIILDSTFRLNDETQDSGSVLARLRLELKADSRARFDALPPHCLAELEQALDGEGKVAQLEISLLHWRRRLGLHTLAPDEVIERELDIMRRARAWIAAHRIALPRAPLYGFWAEDTLRGDARLLQDWHLQLPSLEYEVLPGDHESLLLSEALHRRLAALLA